MHNIGKQKLFSDLNILKMVKNLKNTKYIVKKKIVERFPRSFKMPWKEMVQGNSKTIVENEKSENEIEEVKTEEQPPTPKDVSESEAVEILSEKEVEVDEDPFEKTESEEFHNLKSLVSKLDNLNTKIDENQGHAKEYTYFYSNPLVKKQSPTKKIGLNVTIEALKVVSPEKPTHFGSQADLFDNPIKINDKPLKKKKKKP